MTTNTANNTGTQANGRGTSQTSPPKLLIAKNLLAFERPKPGDASELIQSRYLCRGGSLLLCGATGIGKSSLALQLPMLWALGRGDFGLVPTSPLKTLIIQAENDDGDIAEFR